MHSLGTAEDDDDDYIPELPPGFVPDKSVIVEGGDDPDSDFEDYTGEGVSFFHIFFVIFVFFRFQLLN